MIEIINFVNFILEMRNEIVIQLEFSRFKARRIGFIVLSASSPETSPPFLSFFFFFYINIYQYSAAVGLRYCREAGDISSAGMLNAQ